jgi:hypothetical protein
MNALEPVPVSRRRLLLLSALAVGAGTAGMAVSFCFLASVHRLDVIAGASGFVAGAVLIGAGLVTLAVLGRSSQAAATTAAAPPGSLAFASPQFVQRWRMHYRRNHVNRPEPDWNAPCLLAPEVVQPLVHSLEQFQLGDGGGPACLIAWNAQQLRASSAGAGTLLDQWFAEEREHARLLGAAVARFGGQCIRGHWSFTAFCLVRKVIGYRFELTVLLLTEIVSTVYYRLMRRHAQDAPLAAMCRLILRDEAGHIAFHRERLVLSARLERAYYGWWWEARFRALGLAAGTMLWVNHAGTLEALGASRAEFYGEIGLELSRFIARLRREKLRVAST